MSADTFYFASNVEAAELEGYIECDIIILEWAYIKTCQSERNDSGTLCAQSYMCGFLVGLRSKFLHTAVLSEIDFLISIVDEL